MAVKRRLRMASQRDALQFERNSFGAQGNDRIDAGRAAGGQPRGYESDGGDEQNDGDERRGIRCADAKKKAVQQPGGGKSTGNADDQADADEGHSLADNEPEDGGFPGPERDADSDFARALRDR